MNLSRARCYSVIKHVLAKIRSAQVTDIRSYQDLAEDLSFTAAGKSGLAAKLNTEFSEWNLSADPGELRDCGRVSDIWQLYWKKAKAAGVAKL